MAKYDGEIIIKSKIDASEMGKGAKEINQKLNEIQGLDGKDFGSVDIENAIKRVVASVDGLGEKTKNALNKQVATFVKLNTKYREQQNEVERLKNEIAELSSQEIETDEYKNIASEAERLEKKLLSLLDKKERFEETGGDTNSRTYKQMQYDIDMVDKALEKAEAEMCRLNEEGLRFQPADTSELEEKLSILEGRANVTKNALSGTFSNIIRNVDSSGIDDYSSSLSRLKARLSDIATKGVNAFKSGISKIGSIAKAGSKKILGLGSSTKKSGEGFVGNAKTMLKYALGIRSVFMLVSKLKQAFIDGAGPLAQYDSTFNKSMSNIISAFNNLKNTVATAFAPIVNIVYPILTKFLNLLTQVMNKIGQFFAALTGQNTFTQAQKNYTDYAKSVDDSTDSTNKNTEATKKNQKQLSGLDEMNRWQSDNSSTDNASSSGKTSINYDTVPIEKNINNLASKTKKILSRIFNPFEKAWKSKGKVVLEGVNTLFNGMLVLINSVGKSFAKVWENGTGQAILEGILTTIGKITSAIGKLAIQFASAWNTDGIGDSIAQGLGDLVLQFTNFLAEISTSLDEWAGNLDFTPLLSSINTILEAVKPITQDIWDGLSWAFDNILLPLASWTIEDLIPTFLNTLSSGLNVLSTVINTIKQPIEWLWDNVLSPVANAVGTVITDALNSLGEVFTQVSDTIDSNSGKINSFFKDIETTVKPIIDTLFTTIGNFYNNILKPIVTWIIKQIPSVLTIIGNVINWLWKSILQPVITFIQAIWNNVLAPLVDLLVSILKPVLSLLGTILGALWNNIIKPFASFIATVFGGAFKLIFDIISQKILPVFKLIIKIVKSVWNFLKPFINFLVKVFGGAFKLLSSIIGTAIGKAKDVISSVFGTIKKVLNKIADFGKGVINGILGGVESFVNTFIDGINLLIKPICKLVNKVLKAVDILPNVELKFRLPEEGISHMSLPRLATGAVIPPRSEFMAILGDQKHGNNIETPENLLRKIVREESGVRTTGGTYSFIGQINRRTLFEEFIAEAKLQKKLTGSNPLAI